MESITRPLRHAAGPIRNLRRVRESASATCVGPAGAQEPRDVETRATARGAGSQMSSS